MVTREPIASAIEGIISQTLHDYGLDGDYFGIVTQASKFDDDLGMDDVDMIEVLHRTEGTFAIQIPHDQITEQSRVADLTAIVCDLLREKSEREARAPAIRASWLDFPHE